LVSALAVGMTAAALLPQHPRLHASADAAHDVVCTELASLEAHCWSGSLELHCALL
jgi:hypothetical protein